MRSLAMAATLLMASAIPAWSAPCGAGGQGAMSVHYDTGKTKLTQEHQAKLADISS